MRKRPASGPPSPSSTLDDAPALGEALTTLPPRAFLADVFPAAPFPRRPPDQTENPTKREEKRWKNYISAGWSWWLRGESTLTPVEWSARTDLPPHWTVHATTMKERIRRVDEGDNPENYAKSRFYRLTLRNGMSVVDKRISVNVTGTFVPTLDEFWISAAMGLALTRAVIMENDTLATPFFALMWDAWLEPVAEGGFVMCHTLMEDVGACRLDAWWREHPPEPAQLAVAYFTMWFTFMALHRLCAWTDDDRHLGNYAVKALRSTSMFYDRVWALRLDADTTVYITPEQHRNQMIMMFDYGQGELGERSPEKLRTTLRRSVRYFDAKEVAGDCEKNVPSDWRSFERFNPLRIFAGQHEHPSGHALRDLIAFAEDRSTDLAQWANRPVFLQHLVRTPPAGVYPLVVATMPPLVPDSPPKRQRKR